MKACILAIGSEMLTPFRVDTNSLFVTERLNAIGYDVRLKEIVADDVDELTHVIDDALTWADLIVVTGGLGPTEDDITRDAVARALGTPLDIDESIVERIRDRFAKRGMAMPEINRRQAMVPRGAIVLPNVNGTAPGLWLERGTAAILLLPGPPREMKPMLDAAIAERLAARSGGRGLFRRVLKISGRAESDVDAQAQPVYGKWTTRAVPISTTILAVLGQIELHLTAEAATPSEADEALDAAVRELQDVLGPSIFSVDGRNLEAVVGELLRERKLTIAVAESCTGGLLASRLTDVPGSSDYVDRGVVCYSNRAKIELAGVPEQLIREHGAVSEPVAQAMAQGIRSRAGTSVGIGITGIAGPGGGTPQKPVGTVAIAVVADDETRVRTFQFIGGRDMVKFQATQSALNMTRLMITKTASGREWAERKSN
ncbi:MAG TPA: competence/damage-inducible protein A [Vicinamibacterales bacterium]|nr:competence/damage-inducible protein A [Vicinamibacterales bacterium]